MSNIINTSNLKQTNSKGVADSVKNKHKVLIRSNKAYKPVLRDYIPGNTGNLSDNIIFLGTGAADWPEEIPAGDDYLPNRNWRRQSSAIINQHILIDCGPTVPGALKALGMDPGQITDVLLTHSHEDHLSNKTLDIICEAARESRLRIWGHKNALQRINSSDKFDFRPLSVGKLFNIEHIKIQTLSANHIVTGSREKALHYLFRSGGISWLYATDGAWLPESTWLRLAKSRLNFLIWDATIGNIKGDYRIFEHNSLDMIKLMSDTLKTQGILGQDSIILLTHMARTLHSNHADTERMLAATGILPAYDGLCISFE